MTAINTNIGAISAQSTMGRVNEEFNTAMSRLSSGLRINAAKDDAAGMAISEKMTAQVKGLNQAIRNAADGKNLVDTTEGAHVEVSNMLQRLRELSVQSANDTNTASDRGSLMAEGRQLISEINRVSDTTTFNGMNILDGSFQSRQLQIGADSNTTMQINIGSAKATDIGAHTLTTEASTTNFDAETLTVSGHRGSQTITTEATDSAKDIAARINKETASTGIEASANTTATLEGPIDDNGDAVASTVQFTINGKTTKGVSVSANDPSGGQRMASLRDAINELSSQTGVTAEINDTGDITLSSSVGDDISIEAFSSSAANSTMRISTGDGSGSEQLSATNTSADLKGQVTFSSTETFTVATDAQDAVNQTGMAVSSAGTLDLEINGTAVSYTAAGVGQADQEGLRDAINAVSLDTGVTAKLNEAGDGLVLESNGVNTVIDIAATSTGTVDTSDDPAAAVPTVTASVAGTASTVTDANIETATGESIFDARGTGTIKTDQHFASGLNAVADIDITTAEGANEAIKVIDTALSKISDARADLGAVSNRLDSVISNLTNISTSVQAARSQVMDADFAAESTNLARGQILSQASTAMLAQANSSQQGVLSLLRG